MTALRVLVIEDSLTVRKHLCEVLSRDGDFVVVGEAATGQQGIELCHELRPDVVTLDMVLPDISGVAVTEWIMAHAPTPILVVSASVNRGEIYHTLDALKAGAVDVLDKSEAEVDPKWDDRLRAAVRMVARIRVITHPRARLKTPLARPARARRVRQIALGASTGGPGALVEVLAGLPRPVPVPILVVLHISPPFGTALASWMDGQLDGLPVRFAPDGQALESCQGAVILAPPERHLLIRGGRLHLDDGPERHSCRPSVDVLFESVARELGSTAAACLLTGMGKDGAAGLLQVRMAGGHTIAQDEASSVVYGMPREAAMLGAAEWILPLSEIGPALGGLLE